MSNDQTSHSARNARKAHAEAFNEKLFLLELYFDGYLCVQKMFEGLRTFAAEEPNFVYKEFTLLMTPRYAAFGNFNDIVEMFGDAIRAEPYKSVDRLPGLDGLTAAQVADRFLRHEAKMHEHLAQVSLGFRIMEAGLVTEARLKTSAFHCAAAFQLLGLLKPFDC